MEAREIVADKPLDDEPSERAAVARRAYDLLVASVEEMRRKLGLDRDAAAILDEIKGAMRVDVPPHSLTVLQTLCEKERQNVFNQCAAGEFPEIREEFEDGVRDFVRAREGVGAPARRMHQLARSAWKQDPGADRRIREMEHSSPDQFRSPYRGQPELYDRGVVLAFEIAITGATGKTRFSWTRGTEDNKSSGVMLDVLVAAVQWAMCVAWQCSAPPGTKGEGILGIVKAKRKNSTD